MVVNRRKTYRSYRQHSRPTNATDSAPLDRSWGNLPDSAPLRFFQYDADGNLTDDGAFHYAYDAENHLRAVSSARLTAVSSNGVGVASFAYDAKSRRVRKTTPAATHTYFYDDWNLVEERIARADGTAATKRYIWGKDLSGTLQGAGGVGGLLAVLVSESAAPDLSTFQPFNHSTFQLYIPCYDNNGNITRYLDTTGNTVAAYTYDAFGRTLSATGHLADAFSHRFSTKYFDHETGLYYYGYRYYSPVLMRWLNRDPIGEDGGLNLHSAAKNNLLSQFDVLGMSIADEIWNIYRSNSLRYPVGVEDKSIYVFDDGINGELARRTEMQMDNFYRSIAAKLEQNSFWTTAYVEKGDQNNDQRWFVLRKNGGARNQIDIHDIGFWLNQAESVEVLGGSFEYRVDCKTGYIALRNSKCKFIWHDTIDSRPAQSDPYFFRNAEKATKWVEQIVRSPFKVDIFWGDSRKNER